MTSSAFSIGELARRARVSPETLRHYERLGLLRPQRPSGRNHRRYGTDEAARLRFIRRALALGFTLAEVRELLEIADGTGVGVSRVRALTAARLADIETRLADLSRLRDELRRLLEACPGGGDPAACPVLAALGSEEVSHVTRAGDDDPDRAGRRVRPVTAAPRDSASGRHGRRGTGRGGRRGGGR